jgi:hypothetical protein
MGKPVKERRDNRLKNEGEKNKSVETHEKETSRNEGEKNKSIDRGSRRQNPPVEPASTEKDR